MVARVPKLDQSFKNLLIEETGQFFLAILEWAPIWKRLWTWTFLQPWRKEMVL